MDKYQKPLYMCNNFEEFGPLQTKITSPKHQTYKLTGAFFVVKEYKSE